MELQSLLILVLFLTRGIVDSMGPSLIKKCFQFYDSDRRVKSTILSFNAPTLSIKKLEFAPAPFI